MKKSLFCLFFATASFIVSARNVEVGKFSKIDASGCYDVTIEKSDVHRVDLECSADVEEFVNIYVHEGKLILALKKSNYTPNKDSFLRVKVAMPFLEKIETSGICSVKCNGKFTSSDEFEIEMSGASKIEGLEIESGKCSIEMSGISKSSLKGKFGKLEIEQSGSSKSIIQGTAKQLEIEVSGVSDAEISGEFDNADIESSGTSKVIFKGGDVQLLKYEATGSSKLEGIKTVSADIEMSGTSSATIEVTKSMTVKLGDVSKLFYKAPDTVAIEKKSIDFLAKLEKRQ